MRTPGRESHGGIGWGIEKGRKNEIEPGEEKTGDLNDNNIQYEDGYQRREEVEKEPRLPQPPESAQGTPES